MGTKEKLFRQKLANQIESLLTKSEKIFTSEKLSNEWLNSMLTETQELNSALTIYKFLHELPDNESLQIEFLELKDEEAVTSPSEIPNYGDEILKEIDEFEVQDAIDVFETPDEPIVSTSNSEKTSTDSTSLEEETDSPTIITEEIEEHVSVNDTTEPAEIIELDTIHETPSIIKTENMDLSDSQSDEKHQESEVKKEINDAVAINETSVADKLRTHSIQKLADSIALNERFLFSNELFNGNMEAFKRALTELDHIASISDAQRYIDIQLKTENQWNMESETVERFVDLVKRRFN
jgi:hypothetical protein